MKKSAVEFMVKEISEILGPLKTEGMTDLLLLDAYNQAKEMEKEQSESICVNVIERILDKLEKGEEINSKEIFEQYYNETFKPE